MFKFTAIVMFTSVFFLSGCAVGRSTLELSPPLSNSSSPSNGKEIYINSVTDKRLFENSPKEPSIPSLDDSEEGGPSIQRRAVARKRGGFGKAFGDVLLKEGQTVESLIQKTMRQAFIESGYKVIENKTQITSDTYIVDAEINKFWSWMNPGFSAIKLSTEISTDVSIKKPSGLNKETIDVKESDNFQTGVESNWIEVMQASLKEYLIQLRLRIKTP